jgi:hypothetical protein
MWFTLKLGEIGKPSLGLMLEPEILTCAFWPVRHRHHLEYHIRGFVY